MSRDVVVVVIMEYFHCFCIIVSENLGTNFLTKNKRIHHFFPTYDLNICEILLVVHETTKSCLSKKIGWFVYSLAARLGLSNVCKKPVNTNLPMFELNSVFWVEGVHFLLMNTLWICILFIEPLISFLKITTFWIYGWFQIVTNIWKKTFDNCWRLKN